MKKVNLNEYLGRTMPKDFGEDLPRCKTSKSPKTKFVKPFSSIHCKGSLRDRWSEALRDPGYLALWGALLISLIIAALTVRSI
jgi:hypothetical protein